MKFFKHKNTITHFLLYSFSIIILYLSTGVCYSADIEKVEEYLKIIGFEDIWDGKVLDTALKSYDNTLLKSGKFTENTLNKEHIEMENIFRKHMSYNSIEIDFKSYLTKGFQNSEIDFLIKYDLNLIKKTSDNEMKFNEIFEKINVYLRSTLRLKLLKLKKEGVIGPIKTGQYGSPVK